VVVCIRCRGAGHEQRHNEERDHDVHPTHRHGLPPGMLTLTPACATALSSRDEVRPSAGSGRSDSGQSGMPARVQMTCFLA
jgi:hypothetical protein